MKRVAPEAETVLATAEERLGHWSPPPLPEPHEELAAAIAQHMDDPPASRSLVALAATRARLLRGDGDLAGATAEYDKLRGGPFEPEATRALGDALNEQMDEAIKRGDAEQTAFLFDRLRELDRAPASFVEISVADALIAAQQTGQAVAQLRAIAPRAASAADRLAVYELLGNCAFREGDIEDAEESYSEGRRRHRTRRPSQGSAAQGGPRGRVWTGRLCDRSHRLLRTGGKPLDGGGDRRPCDDPSPRDRLASRLRSDPRPPRC